MTDKIPYDKDVLQEAGDSITVNCSCGKVQQATIKSDNSKINAELLAQNKRYRVALEDIAYCKTWTAQNRGMDLVGIAIAALKDKE
jgi:hypothetical protein